MTGLLEAVDRMVAATTALAKDNALAPIVAYLERRLSAAFALQYSDFMARFRWLAPKFPRLTEAMSWQDWEDLFDQTIRNQEPFTIPLDEAARQALMAGARGAMMQLGMQISFDLANPRAVSFLRDQGAELVSKKVDDTTRAYLKSIVTQAVEEGWSYDRTAKAITDRYSEFSVGQPQKHIKSRAHLIAVQEASNAYEAGNFAVIKELAAKDIPIVKSWHTVGDNRVSTICLGNQGQGEIAESKAFGSGALHPPGHVACRCCLLARVDTQAMKGGVRVR